MEKTRNEILYKFYRIVGYDYLFYTVISFLFLTQAKGLTVSQVMYTSSIYAFALAICQIPASYIVEKLGLRKTLIIGNFFWIVHCLITIFAKDFIVFALIEPICALGTSLKGLTETQILYATLKKTNNRKDFAKIEGSGVAAYYFVEAISCIFIGTIFEINNYIPIIMTLSVLIISFVTSIFELLLFIAGFCIYAINGTVWAFATDIGGRVFSGTSAGCLNFCAYMGASSQAIIYGFILDAGGWNILFMSISFFCMIIAIFAIMSNNNSMVSYEGHNI